ncbi:CglB [Minicystis rosea]|nr:CglB [Minicystis rosea]
MAAAVAVLFAAWSCGARSELTAPVVESDGGAGGEGGAVPCMTGIVTLEKAHPAVMFVIDRSRSMQDKLGKGDGQGSRWSLLIDALASTLPAVDQSMEIGALFYPAGSGGGGDLSCVVPAIPELMPATGNVAPLIGAMNALPPSGGTPTADALATAAGALSVIHAATTARALVLATDGGPNCNEALDPDECTCAASGNGCKQSKMCLDDARTVDRIAAFYEKGLPTYVIGIQEEGDIQFTSVLDAMADAGGRPKAGSEQHYYAARSGAELTAALAAIRDQVGSCTFLTTSVPNDGGTIVMRMGGVEIPYDPMGVDGWTWGNRDNGEVVLTGTACANAAADANATLEAEVQCASP